MCIRDSNYTGWRGRCGWTLSSEDYDDGVECGAVEMLDGSEITETTRQFLLSWQANKDAIKQRFEQRSATSANSRHAAAGGTPI